MSVANPVSVAKDSLSLFPARPSAPDIPAFAPARTAIRTPSDPRSTAAEGVAAQFATADNTGAGEPLAITQEDTDRRQETAARLRTAFVEHARTRLGIAAQADAATVITAFFAHHAKPGASALWMENDSDLMLCLAKAGQLFAQEPEAADLKPGHRRLLANGLALALTRAIDWPAALNADPADRAAVFHDGLTLRNANGLSVKDASAAIEARIRKALDGAAATQGLGAIIPQLRAALVEDPTLSFEPLPDTVRYGSREWAKLWAGIQACAAAGVETGAMTAAEVIAFGQAMDIRVARQNQADKARPPAAPEPADTTREDGTRGQPRAAAQSAPLPSHIGVLLMAHAAGKVDLTQAREVDQAGITEKIQAFAAEEFKTELALGEVIDRLLALDPPPTARGIAEAALREQGLDPMAIVIEEPITSKGKRIGHELHQFYVQFNDLAQIEPNRFNRALIAKVGGNAPMYKDVYDRKFDAYISGYIDAHQKMIGLMMEMATRDGFRPGDDGASVSIHRARITSHPDIQAHGFFVTCANGQHQYRYFLSPSGTIERIPPELAQQDWLAQNRHAALTQEDLDKIQAGSGSGANFSCVLDHAFSGAAGRIDDVIDAHIRPGLLALKSRSAPVQDGVSKADRVLEMLVPFYGTYAGIKRGEYVSAYLSFISGALVLIPAAFAGRKLVAVSKRALAGGIRVAVRSLSEHGAIKAASLGLKHVRADLPSVGLHAAHSAGTLLDVFSPVPPGTRSFGELFARAYRRLKPATLHQAADGLATGLAAPAARSAIGDAPAPFVKALDRDGGTLWLRRFGSAYTRFDAHRLDPVGPVLVRGRNGALTPSLQAIELAHHAVSDPATLSMLARTRISADGTVTVNGRTFAPIAGAYVEIVPRTPTHAGAPPAWQAGPVPARATGDAAADMPTALTYSPGQGGWIDLAHLAQDLELPAGVIARYRVADAGLREALAAAQVSADGTILFGAKRYARIRGDYLELVADHAAATPEQPVWRIAGAPLSGTPEGAPRLTWDKDLRVWREADNIPALRGGGRYGAHARLNIQPVSRTIADSGPPDDLGGRAVVRGGKRHEFEVLQVRQTQTVEETEAILREATDLTHYPWWKEEIDDYLEIVVPGLERSVYAQANPGLADPAAADGMKTAIKNDMRTFLIELYARSETFRGLANNARAKGILRKDQGWVLRVSLPTSMNNGKATLADSPRVLGSALDKAGYPGEKTIVVPDIQSPPFVTAGEVINQDRRMTFGIIIDGGRHAPQRAPSCTIHEFVHVLTRSNDPRVFTDRGAVEYLTQRIAKEAGIDEPRRLTYLVPLNGDRVYKYTKAETERLHLYVDAEDDYLAARFPMSQPPATKWYPAAGNDRWPTAS